MERPGSLLRLRHRGMNRRWLAAPANPRVLACSAAAISFAACYPGPVDPIDVPSIPDEFERFPYVQNVTDSAAWVLWMPAEAGPDSAWFRVPSVDSTWSVAAVEDHGAGTRRARLGPLPASTDVEYRVVSTGVSVRPPSLSTAPPDGESGEEPVRVLLFGDSGWGGSAQLDLARRMAVLDFDLAIHVGDIAYDDGSKEDFTRRHFAVYSRIFDAVPFYPSVGNHDIRADGGDSYDAAFLWPAPYADARYYEFRWGDVQFISIDTSSRTEDVSGLRQGTGRQYEWLERTLREAASDSTVRWIVTFMHHPVYSHAIGISGHEPDRNIRRNLGPLFERYGVDLVTAGHDHHYERTWPLLDGRRVEPGCGPVHILSGGGGASRYARDVRASPLAAYVGRVFQFVDLRIEADRIRGRTFDRAGTVIDEFTVHPFGGTAEEARDRCQT